jgi:hypothetical protein
MITDPHPAGDASVAQPAPTRRCGRCLSNFPVEPGTHPMELRDWWICPSCTHALIPGQRRAATPTPDRR